MDKSDLDIYQNIVVTGDNSTTTETISSYPYNYNLASQICQICGVVLKIDAHILQMQESLYKQLGTPFSSGSNQTGLGSSMAREIDTGAVIATSANLDTDMEISLSAAIIDRSTTTNYDEELDMKIYEPQYRKNAAPRSFYLCPTTINIIDSTSNNHSANLNNDLMTGWSARINATSALFDMMSSNTNIDHPLCEECADQLVNQLDAQCKLVEKEHADYTSLVNRLGKQVSNESEIAELENELKLLDMEEKELLDKLQQSEKKEADLRVEKEKLAGEEASILHQEQSHLLEYSNFKRQLIKLEEKQESLDNQLRNTKFHFNRLRTVNVLNAAFHIWHSGPFGTINYFRLGSLPGTTVEWEEINAGLGQVNLLLYCLARKVKLDFKRFRLVPYGSYSYIEVIETYGGHKVGDELNMYRLKGYKYYFEWDNKFDHGMIAFLDCLKQFEDKIKQSDPLFQMPYKINGHKLEDKNGSSFSIKCQFNTNEEWTKALKYMLTNLKWSLAMVTSKF
jgi:beclin 1